MRSSARVAESAFLTLICFTTITFAQAPSKQPAAKAPHGSISGRITIKDKPAAGVMVGLRHADGLNPFEQLSKAMTDQDGVYKITNIAPGSYFVLPSAPAYVWRDANYNAQTVLVGEDENVEGVNYAMVRGGVITGKVTDADGRPIIQMQVDVFSGDVVQNQTPARPMYPVNSVSTDDRGIYRAFGLPPGKYKVAAGRSDDFNGGFNSQQRSYKQIFYPDVKDVAKATLIEVSEASEAKDVDLSLGRMMQTFSVSGHVINSENGQPVPNVRYGLSRVVEDRAEYVNNGISADSRGNFIVEGLVPGKYAILQYGNEGSDLRLETLSFDVVDQDLTDFPIKLAKGASVTGVVVLDNDDKATRDRLLQLQLNGYILNAPGGSAVFSSLIAADGSFHFTGLQNGVLNLYVSEKNVRPVQPKEFAIARIEREGTIVRALELKDGESVTGVKVVVAYGTASLRGVINGENGTLPPNTRFWVRLTKSGEKLSNIRQPQVDSRGHFLAEGLPAGMYDVFVTVVGNNQLKPPKRTVTLTDGAVTDLVVVIDLTPTSP
jgi:5-hydroxyisourate hydrolase-like protein (transthyretin family)